MTLYNVVFWVTMTVAVIIPFTYLWWASGESNKGNRTPMLAMIVVALTIGAVTDIVKYGLAWRSMFGSTVALTWMVIWMRYAWQRCKTHEQAFRGVK